MAANHNALLVATLIAFRIVNSCVFVSTFFSPDEYWQSLEVAHRMVFGYGYLTWEWHREIRSIIHPLIFASGFKLLQLLNLDSPFMVLMVPKVIQGVMSGLTDYFAYKFAREVYGSEIGHWSLIFSIISWFQFYSGVRTFVNCFEMFLLTFAVYLWPRSYAITSRSLAVSLVLASLSCLIRPTAFLFWSVMGLLLLRRSYKLSFGLAFNVALRALVLFLCTLAFVCLIDSLYYGHFVITSWNFFQFNVSQNISLFYGGHPFYWYLTQGIPVILTTFTPLFLLSIVSSTALSKGKHERAVNNANDYLIASALSTLLQSALAHKEFRFLQPFVPFMLIKCAQGWTGLNDRWRKSKLLMALIIIPQIIMALYMSLFHQQGAVEVIRWLANTPYNHQEKVNVLLLMGCHATPYYSHLHRPDIYLDMITCEPPLGIERDRWNQYRTESDLLYLKPIEFTKNRLAKRYYTFIILFEEILSRRNPEGQMTIEQFLLQANYRPSNDRIFFNSHFIDDDKKAGRIFIFQHNSSS